MIVKKISKLDTNKKLSKKLSKIRQKMVMPSNGAKIEAKNGGSGGIRTHDQRLMSPLLYH